MISDRTATLASPQLYTDVNGLHNLKVGGGDEREQLKKIAQQFEGLMLQMMLKSMRQANAVFAEGNPLGSSEQDFYQEMFDQQIGVTLAGSGRGMGIADALVRQLQSRYPSAGGEAEKVSRRQGEGFALPERRAIRSALETAAAAGALAADFDAEAFWETVDSAALAVADTRTFPAQTRPLPDFDGTPATFVNALLPLAEKVGAELGVDSRVLLAQAALETGWGQKLIARDDGRSSYNFFNIKAGANWRGDTVTVSTVEYRNGVALRERALFRAYETPEQSFTDYAQLIANSPRYRQALAQADDPAAYIRALKQAGYATDPRYADKVLQVMNGRHMRGEVALASAEQAAGNTAHPGGSVAQPDQRAR
jgi:flagellar protein FlgJ